MGEDNYQFYFDDAMIAQAGKKKQEVIDEAIDFLKQDEQYVFVFDYEKVAQTTMPDYIKTRMTNGYMNHRSGEIGFVTRAQYFGAKNAPDYKGTSHGQPYNYDSHIPWLMYGWHVNQGETNQEVTINDIAATICGMLKIQAPSGCIGKAVLR